MTLRHLRLPAAIALAAALAAVLFVATSRGDSGRGVYIAHPEADVVSGELVIQFRDGVPQAQREQLLAAYGVTIEREMLLDGFVVVNVPEAQKQAIGRALAESDAVAVAEEVPLRYPAAAPNDPSYPQQWHLHMIGVSKAHDTSMGAGSVVAVVDTGVAFQTGRKDGVDYGAAPDLAGTLFVSPYDAIADDSFPFDDYGHGTHISGTIAQTTNNGIATAGIAPEAAIMPVKVCRPAQGAETRYGCPPTSIADGIVWAVDKGAHVINLSIAGGPNITTPERAALAYAASAGVTVVAAAGNGGDDLKGDPFLEYPAAVASVISVGAVGKAGIRSYYSNFGVNEDGQLGLDLVAPGGDPPIVVPGSDPPLVVNNEGPTSYIYQQTSPKCTATNQDFTQFFVTPCGGTSMAAAHVSGVAALIHSRFPNLIPSQIRSLLRCSADDIGEPGPDNNYGHGLVQAAEALEDADQDNIPDCLDDDLSTPSPTPVPPPNDCIGPSITPGPTPTPEPTPTASPSGTAPTGPTTPPPTNRPTATAEPSQTESGGGVDTPTESPTPTPTDAGAPMGIGTPTDTPTPTDTSSPTATPTVTPTGVPTDTPTDAPTQSPTETPTETPTAVPTDTPTPSPRAIKCGDVDCSGDVNGRDSLGVLHWVARLEPVASCIGKGYVNCDGVLNAQDATTILRFSGDLPLNLPANCPGID